MNNLAYLEESLKIASALRYVGRVKRASGRVVAFCGLREHIYRCARDLANGWRAAAARRTFHWCPV